MSFKVGDKVLVQSGSTTFGAFSGKVVSVEKKQNFPNFYNVIDKDKIIHCVHEKSVFSQKPCSRSIWWGY